ncbi:MAG: hypothetical protein R3C32_15215 [Chloroflexota bacterium]
MDPRAPTPSVLADTRSSDDWVARRHSSTPSHDADGAHALRSRILHDLAQAKRHTMRDAPGQLALARQAVVEAEVADEPVTRCSAYLCASLAEADAGLALDVGLLDRAMSLAHRTWSTCASCSGLPSSRPTPTSTPTASRAETALRALRARAIELGDWVRSRSSRPTSRRSPSAARGLGLARRLATEAEAARARTAKRMGWHVRSASARLWPLASGDEAAGLPAVEEGLELARVIASRSVERDRHMALGLLALSGR